MKILLLKQNVTDLDTLNKGIALCKHLALDRIGLNLEFTIHDTAKEFSSLPFPESWNLHGYQIDPAQIFVEAKKFNEPFDIDMLVFDATKIIPSPTNPTDGGMNIQLPIQWYTTYPEVFAQYFFHELCHYDAVAHGVEDITHLLTDGDLQKKYFDLYAKYKQLQPIDYYMYLLNRFPAFLTAPTVTLHRFRDDGVEALGDLTYGIFACKTLERPWKNNQTNISCIPTGLYTVKWTYSWRFLKYTYEIQNVPGRTGIRIHPGNMFFDVDGCILLGTGYGDVNHDKSADIINSAMTLKKFEAMMQKKNFMLKIV